MHYKSINVKREAKTSYGAVQENPGLLLAGNNAVLIVSGVVDVYALYRVRTMVVGYDNAAILR